MTITKADLLGQFNIVVPLYFYAFFFQQLDMLRYGTVTTRLLIDAAMIAKFLIVEKALGVPTENPIVSGIGILIMALAVVFPEIGSYKKRFFYRVEPRVYVFVSAPSSLLAKISSKIF